MERMSIWHIALRRLEMPIGRFLSLYVLPVSIFTFIFSIVLVVLTGGLSEGALFSGITGILLVILLTAMASVAAIGFPILDVQRSASLIEAEMHMFITRMGILSIGEVGAQSIFDILKQMRDYGELATEVQRIETLVDKWHTSLPEAARIVAQQSPSPLWSDFLSRMAFSIEAGQPIDQFMRSEQETIAEQYNTLYDTRLESVDTLKEIYVSLVTAGLFGLVIAGIHLVLFEVGSDTDTPIEVASRLRFLLLASLVFGFVQMGAVFAFRATIPKDLTFARDEMDTPFRINFRRSLLISGLVTIVLVVTSVLTLIWVFEELTSQWDKYGLLFIAVPLSPLLIPSLMIRREENQIQRRDQTYPDFIRALGGTAQARSSEPSATIKALRGIDFGMLDNSIDRLEKRLSTRIDSDRAWDYFTADTNSAVISRYTRIYIEGSQSSGQPAATAEMVSRSVGNLLSLRNRRSLSANTMWGVALGLLISSVAALNVTTAIVLQLGESIAGVAGGLTQTDVSALSDFGAGVALPVMEDASSVDDNIRMFKIIISLLILMQVVAVSSIATRLRGGTRSSAVGQMILLTWVSGIASFLTAIMLESASGVFGS
ncbi:type II secretion system F family protein [Candidatus Poseidonia alphae]|nr:type II secretion system F family protein [Candidatus Poseidonia alphae]MDA8530044.1 type II secretion system F family protein [Candidatus Poseidonia alphae]MDA8638801.1 type II secretion system F family protein [Candidatus Poseidonia alphae]MDB2335957.1 type II secretion system F family protein [Candidatus Poseidonia alphae]MDB2569443.1 type II secretion system F family protein [Candidatus Poseidonia alphae]